MSPVRLRSTRAFVILASLVISSASLIACVGDSASMPATTDMDGGQSGDGGGGGDAAGQNDGALGKCVLGTSHFADGCTLGP